MVCVALLFAGSSPAAVQDGWTALMWAAPNGHDAAITALLEAGADANAKDNVRVGDRGAWWRCAGGLHGTRGWEHKRAGVMM